MKKLGLLAMAFALVMTMTQCKKENTTVSNDEGFKVPITLNVDGNSDSRVAVEGSTGVVTFENGDVIHVVSNGVYVGTMTYNGTQFSGEITEPTVGKKLQFYFLGNKTPEFNSNNTGCSVVISDQTTELPVISYAPSRESYQVGLTAYNATLLNKCALVKFNVTSASEAATCIVSMNNKVTVDFTTNEFAYSQEEEGIITLAAGNGVRWAILLPQEEMTNVEVVSADNNYSGTVELMPAIAENDYLTEGIAVAIETPAGPIGIIGGAFTINSNGDQVYFSQGNLQYQASTNTWQFAEHQWDHIGSDNGNISSTYSGWIDLFGWGTSGYNHGANCYQPWSTSTNASDYYVYGQSNYNLYDGNGQADWGYNAISNGGNSENNGWRTLTTHELQYVFNTRSTASGICYAKAIVNSVKGVILLPDNWTASIYALNNTNSSDGDFFSNIITAEDWTNTLEANGAVFLPLNGCRHGTSVNNPDSSGYYWSSSYHDGSGGVYYLFIGPSYIHPQDYNWRWRFRGFSVRLVRDVE